LTNKLVTTLLALGKLSQAEGLFQQVLAVEPDNVEAHLGLGRLYLRNAFYTLAQYHLERALSRTPDSHEAQEGLSRRLPLGQGHLCFPQLSNDLLRRITYNASCSSPCLPSIHHTLT
jgi:tetratricopeptide (TPR) repeat protein